jgi:hypothetical protein
MLQALMGSHRRNPSLLELQKIGWWQLAFVRDCNGYVELKISLMMELEGSRISGAVHVLHMFAICVSHDAFPALHRFGVEQQKVPVC